jgi:cardiolipin synthase A/B
MPAKKKISSGRYTSPNAVSLIRGGQEYFKLLLTLIEGAKESIHLQVYIFSDDETGNLIADALKKAAARGVEVYVIADGYASQSLRNSFINLLKEAGVHFRFFEPVFKSSNFYFGRRMHHKVAVIDTRYSLAGGVNIADRYNDLPGKPAWLDFALYAEGEIARELCILCWKTWNGYSMNMPLTPCEEKQLIFTIKKEQSVEVRMRRNDWVRRKNEITASYIQLFRNAKSDITVLCSYFLPGKVIRKQIRYAISRGVRIRIVAAGISDVSLAKNAERWLYDWMLRNKIEIYEYQKNVLHGKLAICDDRWMTIGSYNINDISAFASIELNMDINDERFTSGVRKEIEDIITNDCIPVTADQLAKTKNIFTRFIRWVSYQFIRMVFHLFTFYFKRKG